MMRTWVYHASEDPRIIPLKDVEKVKSEGWETAPTIRFKDFDCDPQEDITKAQQVVETVKGVTESLNGALNLRHMKVNELKTYSQKHFNKSIRGKKPLLIAQIEAMLDDNRQ